MSIADKLTQLDEIRSSMRTKLVAKGVDASTHDFADFPNDVESIPSGGGGAALKYLGQMDTRAYVSSGGVYTNSSYPGPYSTFVFELPANMGTDCSMMILKKQLSNRGRVCFVSSNPLLLPVPASGTVISGYYYTLIADNQAPSALSGAAVSSASGTAGTKYLVVTTSSQIGNDEVPYMYLAKR